MTLMLGDCLKKLTELPDNSVDSIVTDPPYGLSFMGKAWDYDVPGQNIWEECLRVLKPGGHLLAFFGTRTYHRGVIKIEDAGFEIRDQMQWIFGSGFPKSHNLKEEWQGWGTALKPANEPIVVARKPLEKGLTVAANVLKWGTGALNIDGSRIEAADQDILDAAVKRMTGNKVTGWVSSNETVRPNSAQGRWPANIMFDEEAAATLPNDSQGQSVQRYFYVAKASKSERNAGLEGLEVHRYGAGIGQGKTPEAPTKDQNFHPTVKPTKLMGYLINLVTPPNGIVLDPFMGSGTTGIAAKNLGRHFIGIEMNEEYFQIAKTRIESAVRPADLDITA